MLFHAGERDARPLGDDVQDVFLADKNFLFIAAGAPVVEDFFEFVLGFLFGVAQGGGFFEILGLD